MVSQISTYFHACHEKQRTRRACISCMPTRIQCVSYVGSGLSVLHIISIKICHTTNGVKKGCCKFLQQPFA